MRIVFEEYGEYIIAVIAGALVVSAFLYLIGILELPEYANGATIIGSTVEGRGDYSGHGLLGKLLCLWLDRIM